MIRYTVNNGKYVEYAKIEVITALDIEEIIERMDHSDRRWIEIATENFVVLLLHSDSQSESRNEHIRLKVYTSDGKVLFCKDAKISNTLVKFIEVNGLITELYRHHTIDKMLAKEIALNIFEKDELPSIHEWEENVEGLYPE